MNEKTNALKSYVAKNGGRKSAIEVLAPLTAFTAQLLEEISGEDFWGEQFAPTRRHVTISEEDAGLMLHALYQRQAEFQQRVFTNQSVDSKLAHLAREVKELRDSPDDLMEWADCMLLILGAASKQGFTVDDLLVAAHKKVDINNDRTWGEPDAEGVCHHIKEGGQR